MPRKLSTRKGRSQVKEVVVEPDSSKRRSNRQPKAKVEKSPAVATAATPEAGRSRRSSTAAQTAASVADSRSTTKSRGRRGSSASSESLNRSRDTSVESPRSRARSQRTIKKISYVESEGEEEATPKVAAIPEVEEDYNAEEEVESDSGDSLGKKSNAKAKTVVSPPRSRGRPQVKAKSPKGTRSSLRNKQADEEEEEEEEMDEEVKEDEDEEEKADEPEEEEDEDVVDGPKALAPTRRGRYTDPPSESESEKESKVKPTKKSKSTPKSTRASRAAKRSPDEEVSPAAPTPTRNARNRKAKNAKQEDDTEKEKVDKEKDDDDEEELKKDTKKRKLEDKEETDQPSKKTKLEDEEVAKKEDEVKSKSSDKNDVVIGDSESQETAKQDEEEPMEVDEPDSAKPKENDDKKVVDQDTKTDAVKDDKSPKIKIIVEEKSPEKKEETIKPVLKPSPEIAKPDSKKDEKPVVDVVKDPEIAIEPKPLKPKESGSSITVETKKETAAPIPELVKAEQAQITTKVPTSPKNEPIKAEPSPPKKNQSIINTTPAIVVEPPKKASSPVPETKPVQNNNEQTKSLPSSQNAAIDSTLNQKEVPKNDKESVNANGMHELKTIDYESAFRGRKFVLNVDISEEVRSRCYNRTFGVVCYNLAGEAPKPLENFLMGIRTVDSDLVCMQAVSEIFYKGYLESTLTALGYKGVFWAPNEQKDGFATFYKTAIFSLKKQKSVSLKQAIVHDIDSVLPVEDRATVIGVVPACGHILFAHFTFSGSGDKTHSIAVANILIPPSDLSIQALQMSCLAREAISFIGSSNIPLVLCGGFHMKTSDASYELLRDGYLSNDMIETLQSKKDIKVPSKEESTCLVNLLWKSFQHSTTGLKSSYASTLGKELQPQTSLDMIWFSSGSLHTLGVLDAAESKIQGVHTDNHLLLKADLAFMA